MCYAIAKGRGFARRGMTAKLADHLRREAFKLRDHREETLTEIGRSCNVSGWTISRLPPQG